MYSNIPLKKFTNVTNFFNLRHSFYGLAVYCICKCFNSFFRVRTKVKYYGVPFFFFFLSLSISPYHLTSLLPITFLDQQFLLLAVFLYAVKGFKDFLENLHFFFSKRKCILKLSSISRFLALNSLD